MNDEPEQRNKDKADDDSFSKAFEGGLRAALPGADRVTRADLGDHEGQPVRRPTRLLMFAVIAAVVVLALAVVRVILD